MDNIFKAVIPVLVIIGIAKFFQWVKDVNLLSRLSNFNKQQKIIFSVWLVSSVTLGMYFGISESYDLIDGLITSIIYSIILGIVLFIPTLIMFIVWKKK